MTILSVKADSFKIDGVFRISRGSRTVSKVVTVTLMDGEFTGVGECVPYPRYGESVESVIAEIESIAPKVADGLDRIGLQDAMPAGAARNAIDCAFWDLEAKKSGKRVWELLDLPAPDELTTAFTISFDEPDTMRAKAAENAHRPLLKVKLASADDLPRVQAVRQGAPNARIVVDANEGWTADSYDQIIAGLVACGVVGVEQPMPAADDSALADLPHPIPLIADESAHTTETLPKLIGLYDMVNIKLDKTGGLTEALKLKAAAEAAGMKIMVGCMVGSSLAMAPAMVLASGRNGHVDLIDLDGPLLLAEDRVTPIKFNGSIMSTPERDLWG